MSRERKKRVLIVAPGFIPSTIIGVMRPLGALAKRGEIGLRLRLANFSPFLASDLRWCNIVVFTRNCEIADLKLLYELKRQGKKVIYDIDDNFEEIPLSSDVAIYHRHFFRLHVIRRFFELADVVRVYSDRMAERARLRGAEPEFVRCYFDMALTQGIKPVRRDDKIKIAYPTGRLDDPHLENMLYSAVAAILAKYRGKVEFHLWRKEAPARLKGVEGVVLNKPVMGYDNFIRSFYKAGFDIGLAPGVDTPFFRSKTNNKYREFGGCGIAGIYSNFPPYSNTIEDGKGGLLVDSSIEAWTEAMERLINEPALRQRIAEAARQDIATNYTFENELEGWRRALRRAVKAPPADMSWLPKYEAWFLATVDLRGYAEVKQARGESDDERTEHLQAAASHLPSIGLVSFPNVRAYLGAPSRKGYGAAFYLVNNEAEFDACVQLLGLGNSAIIDLSQYQGEVLPLIRKLGDSLLGLPMSFIVRKAEAPIIESSLDIDAGHIWAVDPESFSAIPMFSSEGYPSVYTDVIEHHIRYGPSSYRTRMMRFLSRFDRYVALWNAYKRRFATLWKYLGWRFGRRTF